MERDTRVEGAHELAVAPGLDGGLRREQPDPPVSRRLYRGVGLRRDHADDRHRQLFLELRQRRRRGGVAGHEDQLHVLCLEKASDLGREAADLRQRPRAVRQARVVAEVDEVLVRQGDQALVQDGEAADSGVEHADGPRIHSG